MAKTNPNRAGKKGKTIKFSSNKTSINNSDFTIKKEFLLSINLLILL